MLHIPAHKFEYAPDCGPASAPRPPASWKVEVIADSSGQWCGNAVRYASKKAAEIGAADLAWRWLAVRDWRVVESDEPANYDIVDGKMISLGAPK